MPREALVAAIECTALSGHPSPEVVFFGGEPLLEGLLLRKAVALLRARTRPGWRARLRLVTNGTLLDDETIRFVRAEGIAVDLSSDGIRASQELRAPGTFDGLDRLLRRLSAEGFEAIGGPPRIRMTLTGANVRHLSASFSYLRSLGATEIDVAPALGPTPPWGASAARELDRQLSRVVRLCAADRRPSSAAIFAPLRPVDRTSARGAGPICGAGRRGKVFVDVDGSLAPCSALARSSCRNPLPLFLEAISIWQGLNVTDPPVETERAKRELRLHGLPFFVDLAKKRSVRGPCASCEALSECFVCPAAIAFAPEQDPGLVPAIQCDWNRLVARHRRAFLARLASRGSDPQRAGSSSSAAETSAVTPARIDGA